MNQALLELTVGVLRTSMDKYLLSIENLDLSQDFLSIVSDKLRASGEENIDQIVIPQVILQEAAALHGLLLATLAYSYDPHIDGVQVAEKIELPIAVARTRFEAVVLSITRYMETNPEVFEVVGELDANND